MYIRKVVKKSGNYQKVEYRLVENYRTANGPRQRTILTLKDFDLPEHSWKLLADSIEAKLKRQGVILNDEKIEALAEHYVSLIEKKSLAEHRNVQILQGEDAPSDYETVSISSICNKHIRSIGAEHLGLSAYNDLGFGRLFTELGFNQRQCNLAALSIIGRLVNPGSENATREWAIHRSGLGELLGADYSDLSNNSLYRIADKIYEHKKVIEEHLQNTERTLFNLSERVILYDLTNVHLEGRACNNPKAQFGFPKQKRTDCRLITLGLVIDEHGFPKRSLVMEGNQSEPQSLIEMIALLENKSVDDLEKFKHDKKNRTVVVDAGITTKDNLEMLRRYGYDYLCVARTKPLDHSEIKKENLKMIRETKRNTVEVQLFECGAENILYCRSFLKGEKERQMLDKLRSRFEQELLSVRKGLEKKGGTKNHDKVLERIGRIKERNSSIARYCLINLVKNDNTGNITDITWEFTDPDTMNFNFSGSYFLKTSRQDLDGEELWSLYTTLTMVESAFRSLKSELAFRPVFHSKEYRADSHLFIAVLAYHLLNVIRLKLLDKKIHISWDKLRKMMSTHCLVTTTMKTKKGENIVLRQASEAEYIHRQIYDALGLKCSPVRKTTSKF
jgi:transposase